MFEFITVRELYEMFLSNQMMDLEGYEYVELEGWVRTNRNNGKLGFIALNDGTYFKNLQVVYTEAEISNYEEIDKLSTGSSIRVVGKLKLTPEGKQPFEVEATEIEIEGKCDDDGEGAGEMFRATTIDGTNFEDDFFEKEAFLTVTGQLHVEAFAMAFRDVYTFGPAFRAENSNTSRHASEFWMIEPEIAFADLEDDMDLIEDMVKYCIDYVLDNAPAEMEFFASMIDKDCINRITKVKNSDFKRMTYTEAIEILEKADVKFKNKVSWGMDLNSEHERYICEQVVKGPVFLTDYPKEIKAFYMRLNDDNKTVAACDLLVPGIGELVGGSQREERYDVLERIMDEKGMSKDGLQWYMDLRRYGGCKHAGFGLGFDRFLMYLTGMQNIRDVEPFPRTPRNLKF